MTAASSIARAGHRVTLFDKGYRPGGRLATRQADDPHTFDHGAQYFTVRSDALGAEVRRWQSLGKATPWEGRIGVIDRPGQSRPKPGGPERWVGRPTNRAVAELVASELPTDRVELRSGREVTAVRRSGDAWRIVHGERGALGKTGSATVPLDHDGPYDAVWVTAPPEQAAVLAAQTPLEAEARSTAMLPCWAVMVRFDEPVETSFDGLFINKGPLTWACRNSSKPGRTPGEAWVLHTGPEYSRSRIEEAPQTVAREMVRAFFLVLGAPSVRTVHLSAHRWRYSAPETPRTDGALWNDHLRLGLAGDWLSGARVEGAFLSGLEAGRRTLESLP